MWKGGWGHKGEDGAGQKTPVGTGWAVKLRLQNWLSDMDSNHE